ncbi:hypothetical protein L0F63_006676 [Massospora cicadina]|nr:hypothetical protein L0F63_006676 [Massospora cicadina]
MVYKVSNRFSLAIPRSASRKISTLHTRPFQIAIDGPAASGKSTTAKLVAEELQFTYLNTGNLYRTVTLKALEVGALGETKPLEEPLTKLTEDLKICLEGNHVWLDGRDVTQEIRTPQITARVSEIAKVPGVRMNLLKIQRKIACELALEAKQPQGVVMEGRDIGSYVLPDADVNSRALRRFKELRGSATLEEIRLAIQARDESDYTRAISPLVKAKDAITIDTSDLTISEQVAAIVDLARKRIATAKQ